MALVPADPANPTVYELGAQRRRELALDEALHDLKIAREQFHNAVDTARRLGKRHADRIREAIDDAVADSWWDDAKGWVDRNADWIKTACNILGTIGLALAVVSLFIPGVNIASAILLGAGLGITGASLFGHTALAASGNGSWADVGLDAFALATFGVGRFAAKGLRIARSTTRTAAAGVAHRTAREAFERSAAPLRRLNQGIRSRPYTSGSSRLSRQMDDLLDQQAREAGERAAREVEEAPRPQVTRKQVLRAGNNKEVAQDYEDILTMRHRFPDDPDVARASRHAELP